MLLSTFDRDTAKQYPELAARVTSPTVAHVNEAFSHMAASVAKVRAEKREVEFTFVFAGHGDVDQGQGILELEDGVIRSDDLKAKLRAVGANTTHVILDSCNSFFVLNTRKPGGRRFPTPEDAARELGVELPNVGVFLSTSAEAEVFEWSELGGGVFSHVVRSGLAGAADANHDTVVSYAELRAFVDIATRSVKNPQYRPTVFARGPGGSDQAPLVSLRPANRSRLSFAGKNAERLTLRDADEVPWADLHREAGAMIDLVVPERLAQGAVLERREGARVVSRSIVRTAENGGIELADEPASTLVASRGPQEIFRALYTYSFGPTAFAQYEKDRASAPQPVYGASSEDMRRLELVLEQVAGDQRGSRLVGGGIAMAFGAGIALAGASILTAPPRTSADAKAQPWIGGTTLAGGAALMTTGGVFLAMPSMGENILAHYREARARGESDALVLGNVEDEIRKLQSRYRGARTALRVLGIVDCVGGVGLGAIAIADPRFSTSDRFLYGAAAALAVGIGATGVVTSYQPVAIERMGDLWLHDPARPKLTLNPPQVSLLPGGAGVTLGGTF
jgi:hypothetical protein